MLLAVISDSHDNIPNIIKALAVVKEQKIAAIIHCGDISTPETVEYLSKNFGDEIYFVVGNMEDKRLINNFPAIENCHCLGETGEIELDGLKIGFTHQPEKAKKLAATGQYEIIFYGHTHQPWEENYLSARLLNPGNLAGLFYKATFAIYDTEKRKAELVIIMVW